MKKIIISLASITILGLPVLLLAATVNPTYFSNLIDSALSLVRDLLIFLVSLAVVWFIWNVVKYAMSNEDDGKEKAKSQMIHGIVAIAVIVSIWGLVAVLRNAFGVETSAGAPPSINTMIPTGSN